MLKLLTASVLAMSLTGAAIAQTAPSTAPAAAPKTGATADAAVIAKFKAADKNGNGALDGAEADVYKANMTKIDTDKDGKISQAEFVAASKAGTIK